MQCRDIKKLAMVNEFKERMDLRCKSKCIQKSIDGWIQVWRHGKLQKSSQDLCSSILKVETMLSPSVGVSVLAHPALISCKEETRTQTWTAPSLLLLALAGGGDPLPWFLRLPKLYSVTPICVIRSWVLVWRWWNMYFSTCRMCVILSFYCEGRICNSFGCCVPCKFQ